MDFALTPEHELIREMAYKFGQQEIVPGIQERDREAKSDRQMLDKMGQAGILGVSIGGIVISLYMPLFAMIGKLAG